MVKAAASAVSARPLADAAPPIDAMRDRVPAPERLDFDELLEEARYAYGIRDDNAGITLQWTVGLFRRALLEAGRRLLAAGRVDEIEDVFELRPEETTALLRGALVPDAATITARRESRRANNALDAPRFIGPEDVIPPVDPMPGPLRKISRCFLIQKDLLYSDESHGELSGTGIGGAPVSGPARVVRSAEDAFDRLQPGDILVTTMTTPAYDAVLPLVAGLVVEEGGVLSHAAIVAREFGLPAVIGAKGALAIPDGATVTVDPQAGRVTVS
jgi:pyruvate,water dikinase